MKYTTAILLSAAVASAQTDYESSSDDDITLVCSPTNSTGFPNWSAPCNAAEAIQLQCIYGEAYFQQIQTQPSTSGSLTKRQLPDSDDTPMQSNTTQRTCICQSQFWDQATGCIDCYTAHGADAAEAGLTNNDITTLSSQYCAASTTPTLGLIDYFFQYAQSAASTSAPATATSSFSDPIGNNTAVSLYFTPSVTGTAAYIVAQATGSAVSAARAGDGQIQATASANNGAGQTSSGSGAGKTEAAAVAGLIGVAALVGML